MTYFAENFKTNAFSDYQSIDIQIFIEKKNIRFSQKKILLKCLSKIPL